MYILSFFSLLCHMLHLLVKQPFFNTLPRLLLPVSLYSLSFAFPHFSHTVDFRLKTLQLFVNCSSVAAAAAVADCVAHYVYAKLPPLHALNKFSNNYEIVKQTIHSHIHSHTHNVTRVTLAVGQLKWRHLNVNEKLVTPSLMLTLLLPAASSEGLTL